MYPDVRTGIALSFLGDELNIALLFALDRNDNKNVSLAGLRKRTSVILRRFARWDTTRGLSKVVEKLEQEGWIQVDTTGIRLLPFGKAVIEGIKSLQETLLANHVVRPHGPVDEDLRTGAMVRNCETCGAVSFLVEGTVNVWSPWILQRIDRLAPDCPGHKA